MSIYDDSFIPFLITGDFTGEGKDDFVAAYRGNNNKLCLTTYCPGKDSNGICGALVQKVSTLKETRGFFRLGGFFCKN